MLIFSNLDSFQNATIADTIVILDVFIAEQEPGQRCV